MSMVLLGGNGFLGRHIAIRAVAEGHYVTIVSRSSEVDFFAEHAPGSRYMDLASYSGPAGTELIGGAQTIVYLIGRSVPSTYFNSPISESRRNLVPGFEELLRISEINPSANLVYISSGGAVYGAGSDAPIKEEASLRPISPYGFAKVASEQFLHFLGARYRQRYAILRVANAVGRWHRNPQQGLVPAVVRAIREDRAIPLYGSGQQVRDYVDADDVAGAVLAIETASSPEDPVWNVGSGSGHTVRHVIDTVAAAVGSTPRLEARPARIFDVEKSILDIEKMKRDTGWTPLHSFSDSIERAARFYMLEDA